MQVNESMYAKYLKEISSDLIIENETGWVSYRYTDEKTVYILEIYVLPEFRLKGAASQMADLVVEEAKLRGCTKVLGSVVPSNKRSTESLKALLGYGMRLSASSDNFVLLNKEIL